MDKTFDKNKLDVIIPISIDLDDPTVESTVEDILYQNKNYGFTRFALACPGGGWRSVTHPGKEFFTEKANMFCKIRDRLKPHGISCGWWDTLTVATGASDEFCRLVRADGSENPVKSCPLDPNFRRVFSEEVALFAKIAKPDFIFFEDDYSVCAGAGPKGCFCKYHLEEFARRCGRKYTREEIDKALDGTDEASRELEKKWRELICDSLVGMSEAVRKKVDECTPEIPIGYMQSGSCDADGDCTEKVSRALAGKAHTPFSRLYGAVYCDNGSAKDIPTCLYHALYTKEHIKGDFVFYHETDTFPHTRFFSSGKRISAYMAIVYSSGFDGSTFQTQQLLDDANEEKAFGKMFAENRSRFEAVHSIAKKCDLSGVEIPYAFAGRPAPWCNDGWVRCAALFGIPYTTKQADIAFLDKHSACTSSDEEIMKKLSGGLFLDGDAAKEIVRRGYGKYIGVEIGDDTAGKGKLWFDLGARERITEKYSEYSRGKNMPIAHMFACGRNGKLLEMKISDKNCEVISEAYTFENKYICPAMTYFENSLGGKIVTMGMTLDNNQSQSLFNYRRKKLFEELLIKCGDKVAFVREEPDVFTVMNVANDERSCGFSGMISLINLGEDDIPEIKIHLPEMWHDKTDFSLLDRDGKWQKIKPEISGGDVIIKNTLSYCEAAYILIH